MPLEMYQEKKQKPLSSVKTIVGIAAGKGGVGKSTVTVNLALALKKMGKKVAVLDTDIYGPSMRMMLPEERMPSQQGETIFPAICKGIPMISMAYFKPENEASVVRAPIANGIIKQFLKNVVWGDIEYLLIDFPPGTGDIQLTLAQEANLKGVVMVTTPQNVAVLDVRKAMDMFLKVNIPIIGIVENMSYFIDDAGKEVYIFGKDGGKKLGLETGTPYLSKIPLDPKICSFGDLGKSLFEEEGAAKEAFDSFAKEFLNSLEVLDLQTSEQSERFHLKWQKM